MDSQSPGRSDRRLKNILALAKQDRDALLSVIGRDAIQVAISIQACHVDTVIPQAGRMILPGCNRSVVFTKKRPKPSISPGSMFEHAGSRSALVCCFPCSSSSSRQRTSASRFHRDGDGVQRQFSLNNGLKKLEKTLASCVRSKTFCVTLLSGSHQLPTSNSTEAQTIFYSGAKL